MKRYIIFLLLMMMGVGMLHAQAPQKFSYQAVVRTQTGQLVSSQQVGVRISILRYSATGVSVYGETQTVSTNANGLFTMAVGEGTVTTGNLNAINWADGPYYLKSEIDPMGGTNYTITATKQMMSVPYALYALRSDTANFANTALWAQNIIGGFHESQILTMSHDTIFLSGGSFVVLPGNNKDTLYVVNNGYDTVYYHTYDTINRYYRDTVYTHSYDTVYSHSSDTVSHYTRDTVFTHSVDTVFTHSFDTVNRFFRDTIFNRTFDTVFTHSFDTINRIFLDTVYNTIYHNDTVLVHMGSDTLHLYHVTHDTAYVYSFDTVNHYYIDTIFNRTFDTVFAHSFDTVFNRTYDTTFTHVYDTIDRYYRDTIYNRIVDSIFTHSFDTVYNRTYDTVYTFHASAVDTHYVDSVLLHSGFITSFTESQILSISNDTIYLTGGSFVKLPAGFSGDYNDLSNRPVIPTVPTNVSAFANDAGYLTTETPQVISINGDTIFLSNGGFAILPVGFSGDYNDLTNKPTIPTSVSELANDAGYITGYTEVQALSMSHDTIFLTGGSFVKIPAGFSGDYNDLTNKPTLPTTVSDLANDVGYITSADLPAVPTNVSAFTNDAGYLTSYTETQNLADVVANGNSAGHSQIKDVNDPTEAKDAVNLQYLSAQLARLQHQIDSLGAVVASSGGGGSTPSVTITNGALPGDFSVAADRTVKFSQGNLQYTTQGTHAVAGGETATGTWRFAEHQYDYIGADNSNISSTYTGYIDLFCWGTSGWNSGATAYQPWATSTTYGHYYIGGSSSNSLTGACANADWGVYNAISNGGNLPERWRTLTKDEWAYLLDTRTTAASGVTSDARYCKATVGGVQGLIIFPDSYTHPAGHAPALVSVNMPNIAFTVNNIASDEWSYIELAGAVFLPGAGFRNDNSVGDVGVYGSYWSSSHYGTSSAYYLYFNNGVVYPSNGSQRYLGRSVRLVQDNIEETSVTACDSYSWHGTTYSTSGDYTYENELLHLTIKQSTHTSETQTATGSYTWHGTDYSASGDYTYDYTNTAGCPSTDTLHLTISVPPPSVTITNGALPGDFSVAADRTVKFSQGNLQYTTQGTHAVAGGETATGTWRFAEHQYDYIGADNSNISSTYTGYIDLFGWGTSGFHDAADSYNTQYVPWSTASSIVNSTYNDYGYGPSTNMTSPDLTGSSANYDWGAYNAISNGGNLPGRWRSLTKDEWIYLLNFRTTTVSGISSNARYCKATVGGVQGMIIFPDSYIHPIEHAPTLASVNTRGASYSVNNLSMAEWQYMEQAGAVFLPAAGSRLGSSLSYQGTDGLYWSSSYCGSNFAYYLVFGSSTSLSPTIASFRSSGHSVRLVKDNN